MKVFISADIEGITGINSWDEARIGHGEYAWFRNQMNLEVIAACEGALNAGAQEVLVRDAHGSSHNLEADRLPRGATLVRGWSGHPYSMVQGIDSSFTACMMIGYHSRAGAQGNPLAHTMSGSYSEIRLNGRPLSEFALNALTCELEKVPTVFVSGDEALCEEVKTWQENILTLPTTRHFGQTSQTLQHPREITELIAEEVRKSLYPEQIAKCHLPMSKEFVLEIDYRENHKAFKASFYPNAELVGPRTLRFCTDKYFEIIRLIQFV